MKKSYLSLLISASALLGACATTPPSQPVAMPAPEPEPQPLVLQKVEPETTPPHYHLNPQKYSTPLNPVLVQAITEALTPKIINPATGEVVSRLPIKPSITKAPAAPADSSTPATNALTAQPATTEMADNQNPPVSAPDKGDSATATNQQETEDTQAVLLQIDPALKLDQQALTALEEAENDSDPVTPIPVQAASSEPASSESATSDAVNAQSANAQATDAQTSPQSTASQAPVSKPAQIARIFIPLHRSDSTKNLPPAHDEKLDVSEIDKALVLIEGKARHYPTYFSNKYERIRAEKKIKEIIQKLDPLAVDPRASYEVLLRAMKAHVLARNMDTGPDSAFKSAVYFHRLLKLKPADPETSFWYGFSLGEGGGFKESIPHLDNAVKADFQEAYLSLAHSYLQMDNKKNALTVLNNYKIKFPEAAPKAEQLIDEIQAGTRYSIWQ